MKVHLIRTSDYNSENLKEVHDLLCSCPGPLEFVIPVFSFNPLQFQFLQPVSDDFSFSSRLSDFERMDSYKKKFKDDYDEYGKALTWDELFSLCKFYRQTFSLPDNDFVVLLTPRKNVLNWFGILDKHNNTFVHTGDWENYTKGPAKFPVAYEVLSNVLRSLMNVPLEFNENSWFHIDPLGCFNDFCKRKRDIILKLRTGDICHDCLKRMEDENVDDRIINQVLSTFELIRNQLLFKQGFTRNLRPGRIEVLEDGRIIIDDNELEVGPLPKALYILFLSHNENGIRVKDLPDFREELTTIYKKLRPAGNDDNIEGLIDLENGTFNINKSRLNRKIRDLIGDPLANFYCIDGSPGGEFRINTPTDSISITISY